MDKLVDQLKRDAERIEVRVSEELDHRIDASLRAVRQDGQRSQASAPPRPLGFWLASSLTGIAAALGVIAIVNFPMVNSLPEPEAVPDELPGTSPVPMMTGVPIIDWKTESAMLTSPLRQELEDLQSDIKRAEQKVKEDIGL